MWICELVCDVGKWYIAYWVWNQKLFGHIVTTKLTAYSLNFELVLSEFNEFVSRPIYVFYTHTNKVITLNVSE